MKCKKIAVIGIRGLPATYGGIEKHCEMLYPFFVNQGFKVVVYARNYYLDQPISIFKGIDIKSISIPNVKGYEAFFHSLISTLLAIYSDADILHFHAQGPTLFSFLPKVLSPQKKVCFTCHGIDKNRDKWGLIGKIVISLGEIASAYFPDCRIGVSEHLIEYYYNKYKVKMTSIYNGVEINQPLELGNTLKFNISKDDYFIFVGRLVPEKAIDVLIKAFINSKTTKKLLIVGDSAGTDVYVKELKTLAKLDDRIIFTSYLYGDDLKEVYSNAFAYISASKLEGQPITLLEGMSYSLPVILSDIPPHEEILSLDQNVGFSFKTNDVAHCTAIIDKIDNLENCTINNMKMSSEKLVRDKFSWNTISDKTIELFNSITN